MKTAKSALIYFRPLRLADCGETYLAWLKDPSVNRFLEVDPSELSIQVLKEYVARSKPPMRYNVAVMADEVHIGNASVYRNESTPADTFRTGWFIGNKEYWGGHTSSQVMYLLFEFGFSVLAQHRCIGSVNRNHLMARMANRYVGFREIGVRTAESKRHGPGLEVVDLEITRKEWNLQKEILKRRHPDIYQSLRLCEYLESFRLSSSQSP